MSDLVGADVGLHVGQNFIQDFGDRTYPALVIKLLNDHKRLGEKTGAGFYKYDAKRRASPDPAVAPIIMEARKAAGLAKDGQPPRMSPQVRTCADRLLSAFCCSGACSF